MLGNSLKGCPPFPIIFIVLILSLGIFIPKEVNWDGKDEDGVPIISGSYYIQVNLVNKQNEKITKSGILSLKVK